MLYPGSLGTVSGRFLWGQKNRQRKHWICAQLSITAGHQIVLRFIIDNENHLCFSMFRQYPGSGSFGGRVWGPRCIFFAYSRTAIWALFAKQEGHQIASTITTCTRTDEEPCIPGPLCSCTDTDLFGTLLPAGRSNFGGSPRAQSYMIRPDLTDTAVWELRR